MPREIALTILAMGLVPLASFLWEFARQIWDGNWRAAMIGFENSSEGVFITIVIIAVMWWWLRKDDERRRKAEDRRNEALVNAISTAMNRQADAILEAIKQDKRQDDGTKKNE
jgi:hypothetical protein